MSVEARRMNLLPSPQFIVNRDFIKQSQGIVDIYNHNTQMTTAVAETVSFPIYQPDWGSGKAESGLTTSNFPAGTTPARKLTRRSLYEEPPAGISGPGLLDQKIINSQIHQQHSEIDRFIAIHTEKLRMEMEVTKKRQSRMLVREIEERVAKKLKEKDEEMERMGKMNWVLQERVKRLCVENQLWRDLAVTNEATVKSLRTDLEQVLMANLVGGEAAAAATEDDAESSCGSNDIGTEEEKEEKQSSGGGGGRCRKCGAAESRVLVLPCRHLCLCTMCGSTLHTCPVCNSAINATVHVNFS